MLRPLEPISAEWLFVLLVLPPTLPAATLLASVSSPLLAVALAYGTYYSAIIAFIVIHRLSPKHPLAMYPGPLPCKATKLWMVYHANTGKLHEYIRSLHTKYGSIVRVGS